MRDWKINGSVLREEEYETPHMFEGKQYLLGQAQVVCGTNTWSKVFCQWLNACYEKWLTASGWLLKVYHITYSEHILMFVGIQIQWNFIIKIVQGDRGHILFLLLLFSWHTSIFPVKISPHCVIFEAYLIWWAWDCIFHINVYIYTSYSLQDIMFKMGHIPTTQKTALKKKIMHNAFIKK